METNHDDSEIIEVIDTVRPSELPSCDESENEEEMDFDGEDLHGLLECFFTEGKKGRNITEVLCEIKEPSLNPALSTLLSVAFFF